MNIWIDHASRMVGSLIMFLQIDFKLNIFGLILLISQTLNLFQIVIH